MLQRCPCMAIIFRSKVSCLFGTDPNIKLLLLKTLDIFSSENITWNFPIFTKIVSHILIKFSSKKKKGIHSFRANQVYCGDSGMTVILGSSRDGPHGQSILLIDGVQLHSAHGVSDELQLLWERLAAVCHADVGDVGAADVVANGTLLIIIRPQPVAFGLEVRKSSSTSTEMKDRFNQNVWLSPAKTERFCGMLSTEG